MWPFTSGSAKKLNFSAAAFGPSATQQLQYQIAHAQYQAQLQAALGAGGGGGSGTYFNYLGLAANMGVPGSSFVNHYRGGLVDAANSNGRGDLIAKLKKAEPRKIEAPTERVPDAVMPITAWRAWSVRSGEADDFELWALSANEKWPAKKQMEAKCGQHSAPRKNCSCGLWAFRSVDELMLEVSGYQVAVIGQVALWGRVIECSNGWRAQFAYPTELWLLDPSLESLGHAYGVPVRTA